MQTPRVPVGQYSSPTQNGFPHVPLHHGPPQALPWLNLATGEYQRTLPILTTPAPSSEPRTTPAPSSEPRRPLQIVTNSQQQLYPDFSQYQSSPMGSQQPQTPKPPFIQPRAPQPSPVPPPVFQPSMDPTTAERTHFNTCFNDMSVENRRSLLASPGPQMYQMYDTSQDRGLGFGGDDVDGGREDDVGDGRSQEGGDGDENENEEYEEDPWNQEEEGEVPCDPLAASLADATSLLKASPFVKMRTVEPAYASRLAKRRHRESQAALATDSVSGSQPSDSESESDQAPPPPPKNQVSRSIKAVDADLQDIDPAQRLTGIDTDGAGCRAQGTERLPMRPERATVHQLGSDYEADVRRPDAG
ncbi:hypothetical protein DFH09DRAFT_1283285 [Mycena vulgaris]|nr:hypothetical protein DFH09DRAFT_1283285 [Mycena vulgaris]